MLKRTTLSLIVLVLACVFTTGSALAGNLVLKGSTTVLPIAQLVSEAFMKERSDIRISLSGGGSGNGIRALIDSTTDIGNSSRFIKLNEVQMALGRDVYPVPHRIALDCIVPVVHPSNPVSNLSSAQIKNIYLGRIRDWREVGGNKGRIVVISRDSSSGTFEAWKNLVMEGQRVVPSALTVPSNGGLVQAISTTQGAIGYIALGYVNDSVKPLTVDGIVGGEETTLSGLYPISRPLFMFTNGWPALDTLDFLNFVLSSKGQALVREAGSISLY